jgi:hypothetical protein
MEALAPLLATGAYVVAVTVPPILLNRWLADDDGYGLGRIFAIELNPPWPRGIQEEEPGRWRLEHLSRRTPDRPTDQVRNLAPEPCLCP